MAGLIDKLQVRSATTNERARVLDMAGEDADAVFDALSSDTGRRAFRTLFDDPATPSELAARLDTSVQNVHYHLSKLRSAGLVRPVETVYSEKGNEMTVYGPANDPLVFVGDRDRLGRVRRSLADVAVGLALVGIGSLLVQWGAERLLRARGAVWGVVGPAGTAPPDPESMGPLARVVFEVFEPGLLFFVACLVVAAAVALATDR
jgi:DNA-binding transcriptional ArsR family regulator